MSEYAVEGSANTESFGDSGQDNSRGGNPAWNDLLADIPAELHSKVSPHLQKWDSNYSRLQQEHSKFSPYKDFLEQGIDPELLRNGHGLIQALNANPREVWDAMGNSFGFFEGEAEQDDAENFGEFGDLPPEIAKKIQTLEQGYEMLAKMRLEEQEAQAQKQRDAELEKTVADLKQRFGDFDENYVLSHMLNGAKPEQAVEAYNKLVEKIVADQNRPKPPRIMGSGGFGIPGEQKLDVTKLDPKGTKNLVVEMLREAAHNSRAS